MRLLILLMLLPMTAAAEGPWLFEFELGYHFTQSTSRLVLPDCTKVVPAELAKWYAADPRSGWEISCGNDAPTYHHFLGRRIGRPLPNLVLELGWRHFSSPGDQNEIEYDAIAIRGRFHWGKR